MLSKHTPKKLLLAALCLLLKRFVKQEDLLLVSSKHGYVGNAAGLIESLSGCDDLKYTLVWMGNSGGLPVNNIATVKGVIDEALVLCKAKYALYTHSPSDISIYIPRRVTRVNMWHGNPIKYILDDVPKKESNYKKIKKNFLNQNPKESDYFLCGGERFKEIMSRCTGLRESRILNTGLPRNLGFYSYDKVVRREKSFFLYAPTFRDNSTQEKSIEILVSKWKAIYEAKGLLLVIKLHPNDKTCLSNLVGIDWVRVESKTSDINSLLKESEALITDYSSVAFDYLILKKPVYILTSDLTEYLGSRGGFYIEVSELEKVFDISQSVEELVRKVGIGYVTEFEGDSEQYNEKFDVFSLLRFLDDDHS